MVKITEDEINHAAILSWLKFGEDEIDKFIEQMDDIINMAHQLTGVDAEGAPEIVQVVDRGAGSREGKLGHWESHAELTKNVPEKADGFIKVPVTIDKDDNE